MLIPFIVKVSILGDFPLGRKPAKLEIHSYLDCNKSALRGMLGTC